MGVIVLLEERLQDTTLVALKLAPSQLTDIAYLSQLHLVVLLQVVNALNVCHQHHAVLMQSDVTAGQSVQIFDFLRGVDVLQLLRSGK